MEGDRLSDGQLKLLERNRPAKEQGALLLQFEDLPNQRVALLGELDVRRLNSRDVLTEFSGGPFERLGLLAQPIDFP